MSVNQFKLRVDVDLPEPFGGCFRVQELLDVDGGVLGSPSLTVCAFICGSPSLTALYGILWLQVRVDVDLRPQRPYRLLGTGSPVTATVDFH